MGQVINIQQSGGLGITAKSIDAIGGLIAHVPAAAIGAMVHGNVYKLGSVLDLIPLGYLESFDATHSCNLYNVVKEWFIANPAATIYLMPIPVAVLPSAMFNPTNLQYGAKLQIAAEGKIGLIGGAFSPSAAPADYDIYIGDGITQAQLLAELFATQGRECHIILEGLGMTGQSLNLRTKNASKVSIALLQNDAFYTQGVFAQKHTAIGTLLGTTTLAAVNENIGWVGKFNIAKGDFSVARINGVKITDIADAVLDTIDTNGYIFAKIYSDYPGLYFNDSWTCTTATDDFSTIENNRTWNKASRLIRTATLPFVNSPVLIDPETGKLDPVTVSVMEAAGNKAIRIMFSNAEISGPDPQGSTPPFAIDPDQDVLSNSNINTQLSIIPTGVARTITNYIGLVNPNN